MGLAVTLGLGHLVHRLPTAAHLGIAGVERLAGGFERERLVLRVGEAVYRGGVQGDVGRGAADERLRGTLIEIRVNADGFLRYMVRAIAGTLMALGRGELDRDAIGEALGNGNRPLAAVTAPAHGLTLLSVRYQ